MKLTDLIILLHTKSVSYCYYKNNCDTENWICIDVLKEGIRFALKNNLHVQFVYPTQDMPENYKEINDYIENPMTATVFNDNRINTAISRKKEVLTSEVIYYWMVSYQIPIECQKWHLNRLITLIRVCNIKNDSGKKMSKRDSAMSNKALNEARRKKFNTRG